MKITFILPNLEMSGGPKVVFEYANRLHNRGHDVSVVYPLIPMRAGAKTYNIRTLASRAKEAITRLMQSTRVEWFDLKANLIRVPTLADRYIPRADIVVATWWATAYHVSRYSNSKGEKFYLVQHYEIWGGAEEEVNNSYTLGLRIIVISTWLKNILQNKLNAKIEALIPDAVDLNEFYPESVERSGDTIRILIPYRKERWKGIEDGIGAFRMARENHPNIQLVMFGPKPDKDVPEYVEFHEQPYGDRLRRIYGSCDILVFPSHVEGFGLPPMEAMLCKCGVVTTNVGAVPDYAIPGETALVSPSREPELLAENIMKLVEDEGLRKRIAEAGYKHVIQNFSWEKSTDALEQTFDRALSEKALQRGTK